MIIYVKVSRKVYAFKTKIIINHGCSSFEYNCTVSQKPTYAYSVERIIGYQSICKYIQKQPPNGLFSLSYRVRFSLYYWRLATKSSHVYLTLQLNVIYLVFEVSTLYRIIEQKLSMKNHFNYFVIIRKKVDFYWLFTSISFLFIYVLMHCNLFKKSFYGHVTGY